MVKAMLLSNTFLVSIILPCINLVVSGTRRIWANPQSMDTAAKFSWKLQVIPNPRDRQANAQHRRRELRKRLKKWNNLTKDVLSGSRMRTVSTSVLVGPWLLLSYFHSSIKSAAILHCVALPACPSTCTSCDSITSYIRLQLISQVNSSVDISVGIYANSGRLMMVRFAWYPLWGCMSETMGRSVITPCMICDTADHHCYSETLFNQPRMWMRKHSDPCSAQCQVE